MGGLKDGLTRAAYQPGIAGVVKIEPIKPANWQMIMLTTSFRISLRLIFIFQFFWVGQTGMSVLSSFVAKGFNFLPKDVVAQFIGHFFAR